MERFLHRVHIPCKHGPRQAVLAAAVYKVQRAVPVHVIIYIYGNNGPKYFFGHQLVQRVGGDHDGGLDKVPLTLVGTAAVQDGAALTGARVLYIRDTLVKRGFVDDGVAHNGRVERVARLHKLHVVGEVLFELPKQGFRDVCTAGGGALLACVLKRSPGDGYRHCADVGSRVGKDEVLAAGLAHNARIGVVRARPLAHLLEDAVEHLA
mmetsp:Transcript_28780/g.72429  ORF Transcript_28780/g.72429 Transcript_28780/m.72429 type:complete len:208 (+) Transcript_28780:357-980(+)